jgi:predicted nucleotidyltransferase
MTRDDAIRTLRQHEADLRSLGGQTLYLFGSTARGEARPASDVDLFFAYEEGRIGLLEFIGSHGCGIRPAGVQGRYHAP